MLTILDFNSIMVNMSNVLKRAYNRFEKEVESDKYSTRQRIGAAALITAGLIGGFNLASEHKIDERIMDDVASWVGHDKEITHYDD